MLFSKICSYEDEDGDGLVDYLDFDDDGDGNSSLLGISCTLYALTNCGDQKMHWLIHRLTKNGLGKNLGQ